MNKAAADILEALADLLADRVADRVLARTPPPDPSTKPAAPSQPLPMLLTVEQAAGQLSCSPATVKRLIASGELTAVKVLGATRVETAQLHEFIQRRSRGGNRGQEKGLSPCSIQHPGRSTG